jgi:hypothetical protein
VVQSRTDQEEIAYNSLGGRHDCVFRRTEVDLCVLARRGKHGGAILISDGEKADPTDKCASAARSLTDHADVLERERIRNVYSPREADNPGSMDVPEIWTPPFPRTPIPGCLGPDGIATPFTTTCVISASAPWP